MCLILFAHRAHPRFPLVVAANRDEFHGRPTAPAAFWEDAPQVLAGRDLLAGGTWMGITRSGRWAALTNVRDPDAGAAPPSSRGELAAEYLRGTVAAADYVAGVEERMHRYSGFNLLVGDVTGIHYVGNRGGEARSLPAGVYGLSNHLLDTPWPKVRDGKRALRAVLDREPAVWVRDILEVLADVDPAPDAELPATGVPQEWERVLSSRFILSPTYGTRASTVLLVAADGSVEFVERSFLPGPVLDGEVHVRFRIEGGDPP
jgi:uncharacterized protein with NRDE domain